MQSDHKSALAIGTQLYEYRIENILGYGGFGITYLAEDTNLKTHVAIKEYLPNELAIRESDRSTVQPKTGSDQTIYQWGLERFLLEAQTLAQFHHPNIVHVIRFFKDNNTAYLVMEYLQGRTLSEALADGGTASESELKALLPPLLDGLQKVHGAGFLHRDIKPGNIFLRDTDNSPVLIDFGAARHDLGEHSRSVTSIISPGYAPVEQYQTDSSTQGPWTDIYGLGAVLYRCISGDIPAEASKRVNAFMNEQPDPLKPALQVGAANYSEPFLNAVDNALKVREKQRPQNVAEWQQMLFSSPEESEAEKPILPLQLMPNKNKSWVVPASLGLLVLAISTAFFRNTHQETKHRLQENQALLDAERQAEELARLQKQKEEMEENLKKTEIEREEAERRAKGREQDARTLDRQRQEAETRLAEAERMQQLQEPEATITYPEDRQLVTARRVDIKGTLENYSSNDYIFLIIRSQSFGSLYYPQGEIDKSRFWTESGIYGTANYEYETFVVSTENFDSAQILRNQDSRRYGMTKLPEETKIISPIIVVTRTENLLYDDSRIYHLGDEYIKNWEPLTGNCLSISFNKEQELNEQLLLSFKSFGAESNNPIRLNGVYFSKIPSQNSRGRESRPNYWGDVVSLFLPRGYIKRNNQIEIWSTDVESPEFQGDKDDFQIRDIQIRTSTASPEEGIITKTNQPNASKITYHGAKGTYDIDYNAGTYKACTEKGCISLGVDKKVDNFSWKNDSYLYTVNEIGIVVYKNGDIIFSDTFN